MSHLRIEWPEGWLWRNGRVFFVADDGGETEISSVVAGVNITGDVQGANKVMLDCVKVEMVPAPAVRQGRQ